MERNGRIELTEIKTMVVVVVIVKLDIIVKKRQKHSTKNLFGNQFISPKTIPRSYSTHFTERKMDVDDAVVPDVTTPSTELYERKRKQLFDSLCSAAKSIEGTILEQRSVVELAEERRPNNKRTLDVAALDITDRRFHGQESIFKKPPPGIMKCLKPRRTPGYQVFCALSTLKNNVQYILNCIILNEKILSIYSIYDQHKSFRT